MSTTALTRDDARRVLDQLESGALDALPAAARGRLRADARAALADAAHIPAAPVVAVTCRRHGDRLVRVVTIACPYCTPTRTGRSRRHTHGWPAGERAPGVRSAHCLQGAGVGRSYNVVLPADFRAVAS